MSTDTTIYLDARRLPDARTVADTILGLLGATSAQIGQAATWTTATIPGGLPAGLDYYGYQPGQGLPAWVQVLDLRDARARAHCREDYEQAPGRVWDAIDDATYRVRITHGWDRRAVTATRSMLAEVMDRWPGSVIVTDLEHAAGQGAA